MEFLQFKVLQMKTKKQLEKELRLNEIIWGYSPKGISNPQLAIELSLNGGIGLIDLEGLEESVSKEIIETCSSKIPSDKLWGVRFPDIESLSVLSEVDSIPIGIIAFEIEQEDLVKLVSKLKWKVAEVVNLDEAQERTDWVDFFLVKGFESGGKISDQTSFILIQEFNKAGFPFIIQGGFGVYNIVTAIVGGALGVVLEGQLFLLPECPLSSLTKEYLEKLDENDTYIAGESSSNKYRLIGKIANNSIRELKKFDKENSDKGEEGLLEFLKQLSSKSHFFNSEEMKHSFLPCDIGLSFAPFIKEIFDDLRSFLTAIQDIIQDQIKTVSANWPFEEESEFAKSLEIKFPIIQGPMANITDKTDFAIKVAEEGALPVLAMGGLLIEEAEELFAEFNSKFPKNQNYAGGIIGLEVMKERREAHISLMAKNKTPICLIAAGTIQLATRIQKMGMKTIIHTPALSLFKEAIKYGHKHVILEGSECGGHIGIFTSLTLWESILQYLSNNANQISEKINIVFAGGIGDELGAAMVAGMVGNHLDLINPGIQMGTAYLFTDEIVKTKALTSLYQEKLLDSNITRVIGSTVNTRARVIPSEFVSQTIENERIWIKEGLSIRERKKLYEKDNLGALRIAAKAEIWNEDYVPEGDLTQFNLVDEKDHVSLGCFMAGEIISLKRNVVQIKDLHYDIVVSGKELFRNTRNSIERMLTRDIVSDVPKIQISELSSKNRIAIVGLGCIFPDSANISEYWANITSKKYSITEIPDSRWDKNIHFDEDKTAQNKSYSKIGAFVKDYKFNSINYRIPPKIADSMDEVQKWSLDAAKQALEDAGISTDGKNRLPIAVIIGNALGGENQRTTNKGLFVPEFLFELENNAVFKSLGEEEQNSLLQNLKENYDGKYPSITEDSMPGELSNIISGRIANVFNLTGKSMTTDAACASSIAALDTAIKSLTSGDFDTALVGGADRSMDIASYVKFSKIGALSAKGSCPFDESADGFVMGEGAGFMVLKRLEDAIRAENKIYAVIPAIGSSSDGKGKSITAPNPVGQKQAISMALRLADLTIDEVDYIEAHGTSTIVGDAVELNVLKEVFQNRKNTKKLAVGSIKSQIGHLKAAAGIASLIKTALTIYNKILPPSINVQTLNPKIDWDKSKLKINKEPIDWGVEKGILRRAGVSAFGFGGTNYHTILEEYSSEKVKYIFDESLLLVAETIDLTSPSEISLQSIKPKLSFMFTGQGSQYLGMAKHLYENSSIVAQTFEKAEKIWFSYYSYSLKEIIFGSEKLSTEANKKRLTDTKFTQPALFIVDIAIARLLSEEGILPDIVSGHSLGEYVALVIAGSLSFEDGLRAVIERGRAMSRAGNTVPGAMAAVLAPIDIVKEIVNEVKKTYLTIANYNSKSQTVVSGDIESVEEILEISKKRGVKAIRLNVSTAFHSQIVKNVEEEMEKVLSKIEFKRPSIPVFSNVTSLPYPNDPSLMRNLLVEQISSSVRWVDEVENMYKAGARYFVEVGPKKALFSFAKDILKDKNDINVFNTLSAKDDDINKIKDTVNKIIQAGYENGGIDFSTLDQSFEHSIVQKEIPVFTSKKSDFESFIQRNPSLLENFLKTGHDIYTTYLGKSEAPTETRSVSSLSEELIGITGVGIGLPGKSQNVFDDENIDLILSGHNFIDTVEDEIKQQILDKNINRLIKSPDGSASFEEIKDLTQVISLAGQIGKFDPINDFGLNEKFLQSLDITFTLAICAGLEALTDAGIPLVKSSITTTTGKILEGEWALPEELQEETGIVFASAFPGYDNLIKEISEYQESGEERSFSRNFLFKILSLGHAQFAQMIKAKGPNTQINAACASTTQAIGIAEDWIKTGRCNRVIVIAADDAASENLLPWIGSGFLVAGGVTTEGEIEKAALPFGKNRHGLIIGSAAAGLIIEKESAYEKRGVKPIVDLIGSQFTNSAFHGSRLDVKNITKAFETFIDKVEKNYNISRKEIAENGIFVSHETYTPARGGSAEAEIEALKSVFGTDVSKLIIVNTKGYTGHAMGAGVEECVAIKSMERGIIPPIANYSQIDPAFNGLSFSKGENRRAKYAIRLAAGFGSQIAFTAFRLNTHDDRYDLNYHENWLNQLNGSLDSTFLDGRVLKMRTKPRKIDSTDEKLGRKPVLHSVGSGNVLSELTNIISEITGYESNLIEADMHLEEDLGIDTVKQAEIFGIIRDKWDLELDETLSLAEFTSPNKIVSYILEKLPPDHKEESSKKTAVSQSIDDSSLNMRIREIISETTGYEPDLIEYDMDLEEDLGIDTIKQAEIFGDIREIYDLPLDETVSLAEFKSIQDIANYVSKHAVTDSTISKDVKSDLEKKKSVQMERDVRIDKIIVSPASLNKEKAEKLDLSNLSTLVINLESSRTNSILEEFSKKNLQYHEYSIFNDSLSELKDKEFDSFVIILPDEKSKPGYVDQEIYNNMFKLFQSLELNSNQRIIAISSEKFFGYELDAIPISGGISGFVKTLGLEFEMKVKHLYSSNNKEILQELEYWDNFKEISYQKGIRYTLVSSEITDVVTKTSKLDLKNDDLLLVTGGGRGITFKCIEALCTIVKPKVAIMGIEDISHCTPELLALSEEELKQHREKMIENLKATEEKVTPVMIERKWNNFIFGLEVSKNLLRLEKLKIEAQYRRVDVTNQKEVEKALDEIEKQMESKVTHIVHGAGLEESKSFKNKKFDFSRLIVSVKVEGIWNILNSLDKSKLKRVVCFTSIAGRFGNRGQIDYSFANGYLSRLCWMLNQQGIPAIACDWSAWGGVGMATRGSIMQILTSFGINPIPLETGTEVFVKLFLNKIGKEVVVSNGLGPFEEVHILDQQISNKNYPMINNLEYIDSKFRVYHTLSTNSDLYMLDHQIQDVPIFPGVMGLEMFSEVYHLISNSKPFILKEIEFSSALKLPKNMPKDIFVEYDTSKEEMILKSVFIPKNDEKLRREIEHFKLNIGSKAKKRRKRKSSFQPEDSELHLMSKEEIYEVFFHGKSFQVLDKLLDVSNETALTLVKIPKDDLFSESKSKVLINPRTIEAALQTAGLYDIIVNNESSLPSNIAQLSIYSNKQPHHIKSKFIEKDTNYSYFDVEVFDEKGHLIALLEGLGMIHIQFSFTENLERIKQLQILKEYWQISTSFSDNMMKIIPTAAVSNYLDTKPKVLMRYLSSEEKSSFERKKNEKRKIEYLSGVIAAKKLIKDVYKDAKAIQTTEIRKTTKGQPYIYDRKKKEKSKLNLSITHSGDFAIAAIGDSPIGIDIEKIEERSESFYKEAFTEKERNQISSNAELGTVYWTIKEAITKAIGEGLNLSLHDIEISSDEKKSSYKIDFSSKIAESLPYDPNSFEITNKKFQNYALSYCEIKTDDGK